MNLVCLTKKFTSLPKINLNKIIVFKNLKCCFICFSANELNSLNIEGMLLDNVVDQSQRPFTSMLPSSRLIN